MAADKKRQLLEAVPAESAGNEMYEAVVDTLTREGYAQYTQPDFAKPEKICRYTTAVWRAPQEEQLGLGVGALSYNVNGYSLVNTHSLEEYQACLDQGRLPVLMGTRITPDELMRKYFVLGIKCLEVDTARFEEIFGLPHDLLFHEPVRKLQRLGMVVHDGNFLRLTRKGKIYVDYVCKQFYSHRNQGRLQPDGLSFASMRIGGLHNVVTLPVLTASPAAACSH
jgi:oxygen-independent coproporphyrinogen-3 oxidase